MSAVAVLIPCYNEELTITDVIAQFRTALPDATIYVYDNNSSDQTAERARAAGAVVRREPRQGKGWVVQSMFRDIDADVYLMVDGDGTYPAAIAHTLIDPVLAGEADMVVGSRLMKSSKATFKQLNKLGNRMFLSVLNSIFGVKLTDILSGYRAFSRDFVKTTPLMAGGFEIETELTIKALERGDRLLEVPSDLGERPEGSHSKIRVVGDGMRIMGTILALFRDYKPLAFFGLIGLLFIGLGFVPGTIVIIEFIETGLVPKFPSAILAVGLVLTGMMSMMVGVILHTVVRRFREIDRMIRRLGAGKGPSRPTPLADAREGRQGPR